ncbi:hypothetical protein [Defluviimonas sp. SAOS-178_SWC]|uniref:hypothetical protein n=1 Tax=Defluviimonas sp. SAOS-178_SWC TaxID=3121287 RepID=UPI0032221312
MNDATTEILARITPSPARRVFATSVLGGLGVLLELLAFLRPPASLPLQAMLIALGAVALVLCIRLHAAAGRGLVLTTEALSDSDGRVVATLDEIRKVERGAFAFKPSNGFVLHLKDKRPGAWAPGLWWRMGRRVGVGGVISGAEGRAMADLIAASVARRDR